MTTKTEQIRAAEERVTALRRAYDEAVNEMVRLQKAPLFDEPREGSVIRFELRFSEGARLYTYAGVGLGGRWYLTGSQAPTNGHTWDSLWEWIQKKHLVSFKVASRFDTKYIDGDLGPLAG